MILVILIIAYLLGSIPTAVWIGKRFCRIDVREHGSGNAGATNTFRVLGTKYGIVVLLTDITKGVLASMIATSLSENMSYAILVQIGAAVACILGHVFPIFASFRGGKGVATSLGVYLGFNPLTAVICLLIFILVFLLSRFVSLSSMTAAFALPFVSYFVLKQDQMALILFNVLISFIVILAHRKNIQRLIKGEEQRMNFKTPKL